jgi:hypothetical protein
MSSSFNNFHGRMKSIFHVLSDDKFGSTPRFAPGSKATKDGNDMEVEVVEDIPGTPKSGASKRKAAEAPDDTPTSASKLRPRR